MSYDASWKIATLADDLGVDADFVSIHEQIQGVNTLDGIERVFRSHKIAWAAIVAEDVSQLLRERERYYFVNEMTYAQRYRENHNVFFEETSPRFVYGRDTASRPSDLKAKLRYYRQQAERHGGSTKLLDDGCACLAEQAFFYQSQEWQDRAKTIRYLDGYKCQRCQKSNCVLHVHHLRPIQSAYSRRFQWNFDYHKLHVLCEECHKREHEIVYRANGRYEVGSKSEVAAAKKSRHREQYIHDSVETCQFCFSGQAHRIQQHVGLDAEVNFYEEPR